MQKTQVPTRHVLDDQSAKASTRAWIGEGNDTDNGDGERKIPLGWSLVALGVGCAVVWGGLFALFA